MQNRHLLLVVTFLLSILTVAQVEAQSFSFDPLVSSAEVGKTVTTNIIIDTGSAQAVGVDAEVIFDPLAVEVISVQPGNLFNDYPAAAFDNQLGQVLVSGIVSNINNLYTGKGVLATITWRGLSPQPVILQFEHTPGETNDSNIAVLTGNGDALKTVSSATLNFEGSGTVGRTQALPTPTLDPINNAVGGQNVQENVQQQVVTSTNTNDSKSVFSSIKDFIGGLFGGSSSATDDPEYTDKTVTGQAAESATDEELYGDITSLPPETEIRRDRAVVAATSAPVKTTQESVSGSQTQSSPSDSENSSGASIWIVLIIVILLLVSFGAYLLYKKKQRLPGNRRVDRPNSTPPTPGQPPIVKL